MVLSEKFFGDTQQGGGTSEPESAEVTMGGAGGLTGAIAATFALVAGIAGLKTTIAGRGQEGEAGVRKLRSKAAHA